MGSVAGLFFVSGNLPAQTSAPPQPAFRQQRHMPPADSAHAAALPQASGMTQPPAPIVRPTPPIPGGAQVSANPMNPRNAYGKSQHLGEWMRAHKDLTLQQQQAALDKEPGFHDLPPATQQRIHDRLAQLATMTPDQRQKMIRHNEFMEKLAPPQRAEVRSTMLQLGALPPDQRKVVTRAFRDLRGLPPEQRVPILNQRYRNLSDQQRLTLTQLMRIEPLLPPDEHP